MRLSKKSLKNYQVMVPGKEKKNKDPSFYYPTSKKGKNRESNKEDEGTLFFSIPYCLG